MGPFKKLISDTMRENQRVLDRITKRAQEMLKLQPEGDVAMTLFASIVDELVSILNRQRELERRVEELEEKLAKDPR